MSRTTLKVCIMCNHIFSCVEILDGKTTRKYCKDCKVAKCRVSANGFVSGICDDCFAEIPVANND